MSVEYHFIAIITTSSLTRNGSICWMICEIGGMWPYSSCLVKVLLPRFVRLHPCGPSIPLQRHCNSSILSKWSSFLVVDYQSIEVHTVVWRMSISLSVDEISLPWYINLSTNFRGLLRIVEMGPSCLKHVNYVLFVFKWRPLTLIP